MAPAFFQIPIEEVPGGQSIVALGFEEVHDQCPARLGGGDDEGSRRYGLQSSLPGSLEPDLMMPLKNARRRDDRIDGEGFAAREPRGVRPFYANSVQAQQCDGSSILRCNDIGGWGQPVQCRGEPIVDRHADRLYPACSTLTSRNARLGGGGGDRLLDVLLEYIERARCGDQLGADGHKLHGVRRASPREWQTVGTRAERFNRIRFLCHKRKDLRYERVR